MLSKKSHFSKKYFQKNSRSKKILFFSELEIFLGHSFDAEFPHLSISGSFRVIRATWRELQGGGDGGEVTGMYHGFRKFRPSGVALEAIRNEVGQKLASQNKLNLGSPDDLRLCSMHFWAPRWMC